MSDTCDNVPPINVRLAVAASLSLIGCYAEFPGTAPVDGLGNGSFADGGGFGGTLSGGNPGGDLGGGTLDGGGVEPGDAGGGDDASLITSCDGLGVGTVQTRKLYAEAQVVYPVTCKSETQSRTCRNTGWSGWSGTYRAEQCMQAAVRSCGDVAHGATASRERYPQEVVNDLDLCVVEEQTQTCTDGTLSAWTGTAKFESCSVSFLGHCSVVSDIPCVAGTVCSFRLSGSLCLGTASHSCSANAECQSGACVAGSCAAAKVPSGGTCDETADCAPCAIPNVSTTAAAICTSAGICACANGATCAMNNQCQGTCAGRVCAAPNSTCDNDDDCTTATSKCVKSGPATTGTCMLKDGQSCMMNGQCEKVCRPSDAMEDPNTKLCAAKGNNDKHCDENVDCTAGLVCRPTGTVSHCDVPGTANTIQGADVCDEDGDCVASHTCQTVSGISGGKVCFPATAATGMSPSGTVCSDGGQCMSGMCPLAVGMLLGNCL